MISFLIWNARSLTVSAGLFYEFCHLLFQFGILLKVLPYRVFHVGCVVEECGQVADGVAGHVEEVFHFLAGDGFYPPDTCGNGAFGSDEHHAYFACRMGVHAAAKLD